MSTLKLINEDLCCLSSATFLGKLFTLFFSKNFQVLLSYRIGHAIYLKLSGHWAKRWVIVVKYFQGLIFNCELSVKSQIGAGLFLPHPIGVIIGENSVIGSNVALYQGVTLGQNARTKEYPTLKNNVIVYPNSILIGGILIGENSQILANSVINKDVESNAIVAGIKNKV